MVIKDHKFGLSLHSHTLAAICPAPELPKFEAKELAKEAPRPELKPWSDKAVEHQAQAAAPRATNVERELALGRACTETLMRITTGLVGAELRDRDERFMMQHVVWPALKAHREKMVAMCLAPSDEKVEEVARRFETAGIKVGVRTGSLYGRDTCEAKPSEFPLFEKLPRT